MKTYVVSLIQDFTTEKRTIYDILDGLALDSVDRGINSTKHKNPWENQFKIHWDYDTVRVTIGRSLTKEEVGEIECEGYRLEAYNS